MHDVRECFKVKQKCATDIICLIEVAIEVTVKPRSYVVIFERYYIVLKLYLNNLDCATKLCGIKIIGP